MDVIMDQIALWCKKKEIDALQRMKEERRQSRAYYGGKAEAFSEVWQYIVFGDEELSAEKYDEENERWSERVQRKNQKSQS